MLNRIFKSTLLLAMSIVLCAVLTGCKKEKETIGVIVVKYANGMPVYEAKVRLHQDGQISAGGLDVDPALATNWEETDADGRVQFNFDLEAILNVDVEKVEGNDVLVGTDVIRLLRGKTVTKTVEIN